MQIKYFGTGAALNHNADTMHMMLYDDTARLYIDTGGGMSLMQRILRHEESPIEHLRISHCHSDHLLGIVHILRIHKQGKMNIYCTRDIAKRIEHLMSLVGQSKLYSRQNDEGLISYIFIDEEKDIHISQRILQPLNLYSKKDEQYGFILSYANKKLVFLGDEAIDILTREDREIFAHSDWLLCEAFCLENEKSNKDPHKKGHVTALEAGNIGEVLHAKNMIISHIFDDANNRKAQLEDISSEVQAVYSGNVYVPHDNETIDLW